MLNNFSPHKVSLTLRSNSVQGCSHVFFFHGFCRFTEPIGSRCALTAAFQWGLRLRRCRFISSFSLRRPTGLSDIPGEAMVKLYCPKCMDVYTPKSSRHHHTDGAYFGTGFPHMLFMVHPEYRPKRPANQFVPRFVPRRCVADDCGHFNQDDAAFSSWILNPHCYIYKMSFFKLLLK